MILLLAFAVLLRTWGLRWGLPDAGRYYPYHPDESVLLDAVCQINPLWGRITPHFYNYGTLFIFLSRLAFDLTGPLLGWGTAPRPDLPFTSWWGDFARLLLVGRCVNVALGTGLVFVTWALGRALYGGNTGWLAAFFVAVAPMLVLLGHYMTVDVPAAFFSMTALLCAALAVRNDRSRPLLILLGGFFAGLATGTKYNAFPAFFSLAVPLWLMIRSEGKSRWSSAAVLLAGSAFLCIAAFLVSTPGALLETGKFLKDVKYEMGRNETGQGLIFVETPTAALYHLGISLPVGMEWPLYLLSLAGLAWSVRRRRPEDVLLWLFVIPSFLLLAPAERKFLRYVVPLIPPLAILAARLVTDLEANGRARSAWILASAAGAAALASTVAHLGVLSGPDARDQAAQYLVTHSAPSDVVALASDAWFYTPPIHPSAGCVKVAQAYGGPPVWDLPLLEGKEREDVCRLELFEALVPRSVITRAYPTPAGALPFSQLERYHAKRLVITDYEYDDPERIQKARPQFRDGRLDLLQAIQGKYHLEQEFRPRPSLLGFTWWKHGTPPHDWRYYMPTVRIYERND